MLQARDLGFKVKDKWLVKGINFTFNTGKHYNICGPNGAGKSTLLKLLSPELQPTHGAVYYNQNKLEQKHVPELSKHRAVLSQHLDVAFPLTVEEIVMMGRYPYANNITEAHNKKIVDEVMHWIDVKQFADRDYNTLSGGEKQRVQFARVLAQIWEPPAGKTRLLMLDEPVTYLDLKHQFEFLQKVNQLINEQTIVISILHDMNLILQYADEVLMLHEGQLFASGQPKEILTKENIRQVFDVDSHMAEANGKHFLWVG